MEIPIHAEVRCSDGACGESTYLVINPTSQKVTHLVVRDSGLPSQEHLVPVGYIIETGPEHILIRATQEELRSMINFIKDEFVPGTTPLFNYPAGGYMTWPASAPDTELPVETPQNPPGTLAIPRGALVQATDGPVGKVDELIVDPVDDRITHIILREGILWGKKDVTIPIENISRIEEEVVYLKLDKNTVQHLPTMPSR